MKKLIIFLFLLIANNLLAAAERAEEELVYPGARGPSMAKDLIDLRNFPEFYQTLVGRGTASEITEQQLDLRRHPIVSIEQCFCFMGGGERAIRLARKILELHEFEVTPSLRDAVRSYQDPFNLISLVVSERRSPVSVLRGILCLAIQTPGAVTMERRPEYVVVRRPAPLAKGLSANAIFKDAKMLEGEERLRINHLRKVRLVLAGARYGATSLEPVLRQEMVRGWRMVKAASVASGKISGRLADPKSRLFSEGKNFALLRVLILDREGHVSGVLDPGVMACSGTMPLGADKTRVTMHAKTGQAVLEAAEFARPVIFPGSSMHPAVTLLADAEARASHVSGAAGADGVGPAEKLHDCRALSALRSICDCCHSHAPVSTRAFLAKHTDGFPEMKESDFHINYGHSEQAFRPLLTDWLPRELSLFMARNMGVTVGRIVPVLSTLRDACTECSMSLSQLVDTTMPIVKLGFGFARIPRPVMVVNGYRDYLVQRLKEPAEESLVFQKKYARTASTIKLWTGGDFRFIQGIWTVEATEPEEGEDPVALG